MTNTDLFSAYKFILMRGWRFCGAALILCCAYHCIAEVDEEYLDEEMFFDEASDIDTDAAGTEYKVPWYKQVFSKAHFTYNHLIAHEHGNTRQPVVNRSALRLRFQQGIGENYFVQFDGKTHYDDVYTREEYNAIEGDYLHQTRVREAFLQFSRGAFSLKAGRQVIVWGKSDTGVVTDVFSPRDLTDLFFTPIDDSRIGQTMLVVDYFPVARAGSSQQANDVYQQQLSLVINPDIKANRYAKFGHPYSLGEQAFPDDIASGAGLGFSGKDAEIGLRWNFMGAQKDWSFVAADLVDNNPVFSFTLNPADNALVEYPHSGSLPGTDVDSSLQNSPLSLTADYKRYQMIGGGFNWGAGSFLWKGEFAHKIGRSFFRLPGSERSLPARNTSLESNVVKKDGWDFSTGFDYVANNNATLSIELSHQYLVGWEDSLVNTQRHTTNFYGLYSRAWLNELLKTNYTAMFLLQDKSWVHRGEVQYSLNDYVALAVQLDIFDVSQEALVLGALKNKDRLAFLLTVDF